jgi:lipid-binding SYLF domain-containing protein
MTRFVALFCAISALSIGKESESNAVKRLTESALVLGDIMAAKDASIPQDLLDRAACVVVVPGLKKGAFIIGGKYGRGFVSCRKKNGVGWSAPGGVRVEGGSFGFQIGGAETDVVMLVLNDRGAEKMLSSKFTLGADASVAAGPVGRTTSADTDAAMRAEILTYSRTRGVFAGIALNGATLRDDDDTNQELYGKELPNKQIVLENTAAPKAAAPLLAKLNKYSSRRSK